MRKLVFFIGPAGAGKTTIAKALLKRRRNALLLDMDTTLRPAAEAIMSAVGLDPQDRDSDDYKRLCRDLGYRMMMNAALENVELGLNVYAVGPFTKEIGQPDWLDGELARIGASTRDVDVKVIQLSAGSEAEYKRRIIQRQLTADDWKLRNWEIFSRSLQPKTLEWQLPPSNLLIVNNSGSLTEENLRVIDGFIHG